MKKLIFPLSDKEAAQYKGKFSPEQNRNALFPSRLRELRNTKDVSQQQLAQDIGVTKSTISLYENGDTVPDVKVLSRIAQFYGVSFDYLMCVSDSKSAENQATAATLGLSDESIEKINTYRNDQAKANETTGLNSVDILDGLLSEDEFWHLLENVNYNFSLKDANGKYAEWVKQLLLDSHIPAAVQLAENPEMITTMYDAQVIEHCKKLFLSAELYRDLTTKAQAKRRESDGIDHETGESQR